MIRIRPANERGHASHGWLDTWHTFSFNTYHDARHMGFRSLRVINDDIVQAGKGFGTHPHRDMEIITYILEGELEHKDNMGNGSVIRRHEVQRMSAGSGITHSEFNPSSDKQVHLLQIWIFPQEKGVEPSYEQKLFSRHDKLGNLCLIASAVGRDGSLTIGQDANLYASVLEPGTKVSLPIPSGRHLWLHVATGSAHLGDLTLKAGDGAAISDEPSITIAGIDTCELLLFDLA